MKKEDNEKIFVTQSFLPPREEFDAYVDKIWDSKYLTNRGPLLTDFEQRSAQYLGVNNFQFVTNGTLALQLAIDGLGIKNGEIITTPFSYVATTSSILWQRCEPVFVDINEETLNIDPRKIEAAITPQTRAILAVHVFGNAADIEAVRDIADKHKLKIIYDGAHAFGAQYKGKSLLDYGDVSTVSFHATKLFHTIEGGGIISRTKAIHEQIDLEKRFGHNQDNHIELGINAKANEFQAAMGLANFKYLERNIEERRVLSEYYNKQLAGLPIRRPLSYQSADEKNYIYYPIILDSEETTVKIIDALNQKSIFPRRYFYPSLNTLPYLKSISHMPVSEDISTRILCLPLYVGLDKKVVDVIAGTLKDIL